MARCYRCGHQMKRKEGYFCTRCREFLIKHKVYERAVMTAINDTAKDERDREQALQDLMKGKKNDD